MIKVLQKGLEFSVQMLTDLLLVELMILRVSVLATELAIFLFLFLRFILGSLQ